MLQFIVLFLGLLCTLCNLCEGKDVSVPVALGGYDVVECLTGAMGHKGKDEYTCTSIGSTENSTQYSSVDKDGNPLYTSEFRFVNVDNMIAFENAAFSYVPKLGGFCGQALATFNSTSAGSSSTWSATTLGPPVDLLHSWRIVPNAESTESPGALYLFGSSDDADAFMDALPSSQAKAEETWSQWFGSHGTMPPYALSAGPFNSACYTAGAGADDSSRDCAVDPLLVAAA